MKKVRVKLNKTSNSQVYKKLRNAIYSGCPVCSPHKGCNRMGRYRPRSWKDYRKTQWRE